MLSELTPQGSVIFAPHFYGHYITYFGNRKNVLDTAFFSAPSPALRMEKVERVYTTPFLTDALPIFEEYQSNYLIVSNAILSYYNTTKPLYLNDPHCFRLLYAVESFEVYERLCKLTKEKLPT
ncbi:MAG: hypothetical protein QW594_03405 [Candidatus Woesearchaeota archaeon]